MTQPIWSAVKLQPYRERLALAELARAGFETYCPRILHRRISHGRKIESTPLLFPGYIFARIILQWHAAQYAPGVLSLIMSGDKPATVPDAVIDDLKGREKNGIIHLPKKPAPGGAGLQLNDRLRIRTGPLRGCFGLFAGQAPRDRIKILMDLLGGSREVEVAVGNVIRV